MTAETDHGGTGPKRPGRQDSYLSPLEIRKQRLGGLPLLDPQGQTPYKSGSSRAGASQVALVVKNLPASAGDIRDEGSIPASGRSPGGGHGSPLQYSGLENPVDRGAWQAAVHGVAKGWTQLKQLSTHAHRAGRGRLLQPPRLEPRKAGDRTRTQQGPSSALTANKAEMARLLVTESQFSQFSRSVVSNSLRPHGPQHIRPPCPSPTPRVYSNSCPDGDCNHEIKRYSLEGKL